jgi:hypothetical protein
MQHLEDSDGAALAVPSTINPKLARVQAGGAQADSSAG